MKPMVYPYKIRVTDPHEIKAFIKVSNKGFARVEPSTAKKIGHKIPRSIKRDSVLISDGIFTIYNPRIKLESLPAYGKKKGYDFVFKSLF